MEEVERRSLLLGRRRERLPRDPLSWRVDAGVEKDLDAAVDFALFEGTVVAIQTNANLEPIAARRRLVVEVDSVVRSQADRLALKVSSDAGVRRAAAVGEERRARA